MKVDAYRIETPRLTLACWSPEDTVAIKAAEDASREHLRPIMVWADREPETMEEALAKTKRWRAGFDRGEDFIYGVRNGERTVVGGCGLHPRVGKGGLEIGYWVHVAHIRQGLATEIAAGLTRVAFEVAKARWVEIRVARKNVPSAKIPPKLGYAHEATLRERIEMPGGTFEDSLVFTMLARDYDASPARQTPVSAYDATGRKIL
jgi:RimJ/RimL family protein N-acetyltransferase